MKKIMFLLLMFISVNAMAQGNPLQCDSVIQAEGKNLAMIYPIIKAWAAVTYNSAKALVKYSVVN